MTRTDDPTLRRIAWAACAAAALLLGACSTPSEMIPPVGRALVVTPLGAMQAPPPLGARYGRIAARSLSEAPFERGAMAVVAREGGRVETFGLAPCQGGRTVCAWSEGGQPGVLTVTPDWVVVQGLFGRTFWLSHGGDGYVQRDNVLWSLAWNARADGRGEGPGPLPADGSGIGLTATLETPAPHR